MKPYRWRASNADDARDCNGVRGFAERHGVPLVDWERAFDARGGAGRHVWFEPDRVHLTPEGAALMAEIAAPVVADALRAETLRAETPPAS